MNRNLKRGRDKSTLFAVTFACALAAGCGAASNPEAQSGGANPATPLVHAMANAKTLDDAVTATKSVLAHGGIAVATDDKVLVEPHEPHAPGFMLPREVLVLAIEAGTPAGSDRANLDELGDMLQRLGAQFKPAATAGTHLLTILRKWGEAARAHPADPHAFAPLYIAESLQRRIGVDIYSPSTRPEQVQLNLLELQLFLAGIHRVVKHKEPVLAARRNSAVRLVSLDIPDPCGWVKQWMAEHVDHAKDDVLSGAATSTVVGEQLGTVLEAGFGSERAEQIGNAMSVINMAASVWKMAAFFGSMGVIIDPMETKVHKPLAQKGTDVPFVARLPIDPAAVDALEKKHSALSAPMRACLRQHGLPDMANLADIVRDAENWRVGWKLHSSAEHARWNNENFEPHLRGQQEMYLRKTSPSRVETKPFIVNVRPEAAHQGQETEVVAVVEATIEGDAANDALKTIATPQKASSPLGVIAALVDLGTGWIKNEVGPSARANLRIRYHMPPTAYELTVESKLAKQGDEEIVFTTRLVFVLDSTYGRFPHAPHVIMRYVGTAVLEPTSVVYKHECERHNRTAPGKFVAVIPEATSADSEFKLLVGFAAGLSDLTVRVCDRAHSMPRALWTELWFTLYLESVEDETGYTALEGWTFDEQGVGFLSFKRVKPDGDDAFTETSIYRLRPIWAKPQTNAPAR